MRRLFAFAAVVLLAACVVSVPETAPETATTPTATTQQPVERSPVPRKPVDEWGKDWAEHATRPQTLTVITGPPVALTAPPTTQPASDCVAEFLDAERPYEWELCVIGGYAYAKGAIGTAHEVAPERAQALIDEIWALAGDDNVPTFTTDVWLYCPDEVGCAARGLDDGSLYVAMTAYDGRVNLLAVLHEVAHHATGVGTGEGHGLWFRCTAIVLYHLHAPDVVPLDMYTELWLGADCETHLNG